MHRSYFKLRSHLLLFLNLITMTLVATPNTGLASDPEVPLNWAGEQVRLNACGTFLSFVGDRITRVNTDLTYELAQRAYFDKGKKPDAINDPHRRILFDVTISGAGLTPTLRDVTNKLILQVIGQRKSKVKISVDSKFLGKRGPSVTYALEDSGLDFLVDKKKPGSGDRRPLLFLVDRALKDLRIQRLGPVTRFFENAKKDAGIEAIDYIESAGSDQTPVVRLLYGKHDGREQIAYLGLEKDKIVFVTTFGSSLARIHSYSYKHFEMLIRGYAIGDTITTSVLGLIRLEGEDFDFENLWRRGHPEDEDYLPEWIAAVKL